jgi:hypothetical protein
VRRIGKRAASRYAAVAVAGLAGALAVTGCAQTRLGAAALYNPDQRISSSKLTSEVANLNAGFEKYKGKVQVGYTVAEEPQQVLTWILRFAALDRVAAREGIKVTPAQAQHELQAEEAQVAQGGDTLPEAAVAAGLPPDMLNQLGTFVSIEVQLDNKLDNGTAPKTNAQSTALTAKVNRLQCVATKNMDIKVNPQYGVFDYSQFTVVSAPVGLSAPSPKPSASKIQTTPKC